MNKQAQVNPMIIVDTTLGDGDLSPRTTLNGDEKLTIARQLTWVGA